MQSQQEWSSRIAGLRELRASDPERHARALVGRVRRSLWGDDGRMLIIAADHPARGVTGFPGRPDEMPDRGELLQRICRALAVDGVDGVLATADILEDLAALGALEGRLAIGAVNRAGLAGSAFEIDDRISGYTADAARRAGIDAVKLLLRIDLQDASTSAMLERTAMFADDCAEHGIPLIIEPFLSERVDGRLKNHLDATSTARAVGIATGLGGASSGVWLKLPVVDDMARVAASTTQPILLLGGDPVADPDALYRDWADALALPGVRGMIVGRSMLYPEDGDVERHVAHIAGLIHDRSENGV